MCLDVKVSLKAQPPESKVFSEGSCPAYEDEDDSGEPTMAGLFRIEKKI